MKKSNEVFIIVGFVLCAEFAGAIVYKDLVNINENSPQEDIGTGNNVLNQEKTRNEVEDFKIHVGKVDETGPRKGMVEKGGEEQGRHDTTKNEGLELMDSDEKTEVVESGKQNISDDETEMPSPAIIGGNGLCTCGQQGGIGKENNEACSSGNSGRETQSKKDGSNDGPEAETSGVQVNIDGESVDGKDKAETGDAGIKQPGSEIGEADGGMFDVAEVNSNRQGGIGGEPGLTSTEIDELITNAVNVVDGVIYTFTFSPLDR